MSFYRHEYHAEIKLLKGLIYGMIIHECSRVDCPVYVKTCTKLLVAYGVYLRLIEISMKVKTRKIMLLHFNKKQTNYEVSIFQRIPF